MVQAAANINFTEILAEIPSCALGCITTTLTSSPSALTNITATCTNNTLQASLSACIQGSCNITEQIHVTFATSQLCAGVPIESCTWPIVIVGLVTGPLALLTVALRCYSRYSITRYFGVDDWVVLAAAVLLIPLLTLQILGGLLYEMGKHIWNVNLEMFLKGLKAIYVGDILYVTVLGLIKSSILLFYLRLFPNRWFRTITWIILAIVIGSAIAVDFALIFQCQPMSKAWNTEIPGQCVNVNTLSHAAGGISIAQDIAILILPIPTCVRLNMNLKKKLNILFMFGIGGIASLISILRFKYLVNLSLSTDPSWDNSAPLVWSFLEINIAIICASLPALRSLLSRTFPSLFEINPPAESNGEKPSSISANQYLPSYLKPKPKLGSCISPKGTVVSLQELSARGSGRSKIQNDAKEIKIRSDEKYSGSGRRATVIEDIEEARGQRHVPEYEGERWSASDSEASLIIPR